MHFFLDHIEFSNRNMNQMKREVSSNQSFIKPVKKLRREIDIDQET